MEELCRLYGIPTTLGAAWGVLFAHPHPQSLAEVAGALGLAKSTTSTALRRLEQLRMVKRKAVPGSRREEWEPVTDPEGLIRDWLERFVLPELSLSDRMHARLSEELGEERSEGRLDASEESTLRIRLQQLEGATRTGRALIQQFLRADDNETDEE